MVAGHEDWLNHWLIPKLENFEKYMGEMWSPLVRVNMVQCFAFCFATSIQHFVGYFCIASGAMWGFWSNGVMLFMVTCRLVFDFIKSGNLQLQLKVFVNWYLTKCVWFDIRAQITKECTKSWWLNWARNRWIEIPLLKTLFPRLGQLSCRRSHSCRYSIVKSKDLFVSQSSLTGGSNSCRKICP